MCDLSMEDKKRLRNMLKGTNWVWYKCNVKKLPVVCVDTRLEMGLLSSHEEMYLMNTDNFDHVMLGVEKALRVLESNNTKKMFVGKNVSLSLTQYYNDAMNAIRKQRQFLTDAIYEMIKQMKILIDSEELARIMDIKWKLINNIMKLSAMLVDIHVKKQVEKYVDEKKPIVIFMGAAHAYRLHTYYPQIFSNIAYNTNDPILIESIKTKVWT
jgi:hypothetical protein